MTGDHGSCPVADGFTLFGSGPVPEGLLRYDVLQDQNRIWWVDEVEGSYWMVLDRELTIQGLQDAATFSSTAIVPTQPDPEFVLRPVGIDPPEHGKWRKLLAGYFAPKQMPILDKLVGEVCGQLLDEIAPRGSCDYMEDFALRFPTTIFLEIFGLPLEELDVFLGWVSTILRPPDDDSVDTDTDTDTRMAIFATIVGRLAEEVESRRAAPIADATDIISHSMDWEIDGVPVTDAERLECFLLMFLAGLDTVASELGMAMHHLATLPADRERLVGDPSLVPAAVEELLRAYPIPQLARKVMKDVTFGGQQLKKGQMVMFGLAAANRDPHGVDRSREVVIDRPVPIPHYTFGAGPHRCLGSHLARREMTTALREWHVRIPEYSLDTDEPVIEHFGSVHAITHLPLRWNL